MGRKVKLVPYAGCSQKDAPCISNEYVLEEGDKTLYIAEENQLNDTAPIYINIMGKQDEGYFHVNFMTEERPSVEYFLELALEEL